MNILRKKIYFENLDGLRFLCFLSIFFFHSFATEVDEIKNSTIYQVVKFTIFGNGDLGVNFFFVLSGFLITYLLIEEKNLNGQIDLKKFWLRRALRIWPLFYFCVGFGFFIFPHLKVAFGQIPNETASLGYYLTFLNNFDFIRKGLPDASVLGVLWSIAIEEQFYLVWPIILYFLPVRKYWISFMLVLIISLWFRAGSNSGLLNEFHTLSCIGDMAIGASGAWLMLENARFKVAIEDLRRPAIACLYIIFVIIFFFRSQVFGWSNVLIVLERQIIAIVIIIIILEQNFAKNSLFKISNWKTISRLGLITYGLYCLHFIGILVTTTITRKLGLNTNVYEVIILETGIALTLTLLISLFSYRYFEMPFLRLKSRFEYISRSGKNNVF